MDLSEQGISGPSPLQQLPFSRKLLALLLLFAGCFLFSQLLASGILMLSYGLEAVKDIPALLRSGVDLNPLRYAQLLATLTGFCLPALLFSRLMTGDALAYSGIRNRFPALLILLVPVLVISFYPLVSLSYFVNQHAFFADWMRESREQYMLLTDALLSGSDPAILVLNLLTVAIAPAIAEEWLFRGALQPLLRERLNAHLAIGLTAVAFSLVHFEFSGFLPRMLLGLLLGYICQFSGGLWLSIWAHAFNNGTEVVIRYLNERGLTDLDTGLPVMPGIAEGLGLGAVFAATLYAFYFISRKNFGTFAGDGPPE